MGLYHATDAKVGDIVYNDLLFTNKGVSRYKIIYIDPMTDMNYLYARIQWSMPALDEMPMTEPWCGQQSFVARVVLGTTFIPSFAVQLLDESFTRYASNVEAWIVSRYSYLNRNVNITYTGVKDGSNCTFILDETPLENTLSVRFNGLEQTLGEDYIIEGRVVDFLMAPTPLDRLTFDLNKV